MSVQVGEVIIFTSIECSSEIILSSRKFKILINTSNLILIPWTGHHLAFISGKKKLKIPKTRAYSNFSTVRFIIHYFILIIICNNMNEIANILETYRFMNVPI